jgi:hypothetical protein
VPQESPPEPLLEDPEARILKATPDATTKDTAHEIYFEFSQTVSQY